MSPQQAAVALESIRTRGCTIEHPEVREITGGYSSQSIAFEVLRGLHARAKAGG